MQKINTSFSFIHELLFALHGNIGNFFTYNGTKLLVNAELPLVQGERVLINRVLAVATNYKRLKEFVDGIILHNTFSNKLKQGKGDQYILALCSGMAEILEPYRKAVIAMETVILQDPHQPVSYVLSVIEEYTRLLQVLNYIVDKIEADGDELTGCRILELLNRNSLSVAANIQVAIQRLQSRCHEVLFKQLASWLFQGQLNDDQHFFIQHVHSSDSDCVDAEILEVTGFYSAYSDFKLCGNLLPSYIPLSLARNILYVGQTVVMIQQNPKSIQGIQGSTYKPEVDMWSGRDMEFLQELQAMQDADTFQLDRLTWLVDATRLCVTQYLWQLAVCDARLLDEVKLIKDLYLLGRGELFLEFIKLADAALSLPPTQLTLKETNQAFHIAARNIHWEEEGLFEKFHLSLNPESKQGWDGLTLKCNVQWPLHLLFTDAAFVDYNLLFRFLLRTRRAQRELHALWKIQMQEKLVVGCEKNLELWQLRRNFTFLVDNLQYYLQVDVLESQYPAFINAISATDKFEDVQQAHSRALASIMSQTFLLMDKKSKVKSEGENRPYEQNVVMKCLNALLDLSSEFCNCARLIESGTHEMIDASAQLKVIDDSFLTHVGLLNQLLVGLRGQPSGTALSQLLLRLDFNSWISEHCVTINEYFP